MENISSLYHSRFKLYN